MMADRKLEERIDQRAKATEKKVIAWRRQIHQHPELSNREFKTAAMVAKHLEGLGLSVRTKVAHTGVVGLLEGGRPGPVVALRADMDALPVSEETGLRFASSERAQSKGHEVGVMHACGHDTHVAILMGVAEVLAALREEIPGTVKFIFQPAEEGAPEGEEGGAGLMIKEGVLEDPRPEAIFGLHAIPSFDVGQVAFRSEGIMASADRIKIVVRGKQSHGAKPWLGTDPIVVASQIVLGLQTIVSRQSDLTVAPAVLTIGEINGGTRFNIIPDRVEMTGTIRTFDSEMQKTIQERVQRTAKSIAESAGAKADVEIVTENPVTFNDPELTRKMTATVQAVVGKENAVYTRPQTWAEDFSHYQKVIPGLFLYLGVRTPGANPEDFPPNHSSRFMVDESALVIGVRLLSYLAVDYPARKD